MGFFGGNYSQIPGLGEDIAGFNNFDPRHDMLGLGKWGKQNKGILRDVNQGKLDQNQAYNSTIVNPIKSSFAAERGVMDRNMMMNPYLTQHPELTAAMSGDFSRGMAQDQGNAIGQATGNFVQGAGQGYQQASNDRYRNTLGFNSLEEQNLANRAQARQGGTKQEKSPFDFVGGFLSSGLGGLAAACDERCKDNIEPYNTGLDTINKLVVKQFEYNGDGGTPKGWHAVGVIAQEAQHIDPEMAVPLETGIIGVDLQRLIFTMVNSIKELSQQVQDLKEKLDASPKNY